MRHLIAAIAIALLLSCHLFAERDREPVRDDGVGRARTSGPTLYTRGEGYLIHTFHGSIDRGIIDRPWRGGVVLMHTDLESGRATWMLNTGLDAIPTRRMQFRYSRLIGLIDTGDHIIAAVYNQRTYDRPPATHGVRDGEFRLRAIDKATGGRLTQPDVALQRAEKHFEEVPDETTKAGILKKVEGGVTVFGVTYKVNDRGGIEQHGGDADDNADSGAGTKADVDADSTTN